MMSWLFKRNFSQFNGNTNIPFEKAIISDSGKNENVSINIALQDKASPRPLGIRFDTNLIDQYLVDHSNLLKSHSEIMNLAENHDWYLVSLKCHVFKTKLTDHLLSESVKLYVYLKQSLRNEVSSLDLMQQFAREMQGIGANVMAYIEFISDIEDNVETQKSFKTEWKKIGILLKDRIDREEKVLYPMYQQFV